MHKIAASIIAAAIALQTVRCALDPPGGQAQAVTIAELLRMPSAYDGKHVTFRGEVLDRISIMGAGAYRIKGPNGAAVAVIGLSTAPQPGQTAAVTGIFRMAMAFGSFEAAVVLAK